MRPYAIADRTLVLDAPSSAGEKPYVLKLRDMAQDQKPREKMLAHGPGALSAAELLAVILTTGTTKEDVLTMSSRILREYGERTLGEYVDPARMSAELDIPLVKASQIAACAELGRRYFKKGRSGSATIRTARDVYDYLKDMRELSKEQLRGLYLNNHRRVIHDEVISIGTVDANIVHPREVFRPALEYSAAAVILAHNHPSGSVRPSAADIEITKQLIESGKILGIQLLDHVIIGKDRFASVDAAYE